MVFMRRILSVWIPSARILVGMQCIVSVTRSYERGGQRFSEVVVKMQLRDHSQVLEQLYDAQVEFVRTMLTNFVIALPKG
jgi:hypothetical protein